MLPKLISGDSTLTTKQGVFEVDTFDFRDKKIIVLRMGLIQGQDNVLCRIQSSSLSDVFLNSKSDAHKQVEASLEMIATLYKNEGKGGLLIYLNQDGKGHGALASLDSLPEVDKREYDGAIGVLHYYNISSIRLISNNKRKKEQIETKSDISVNEMIWYGGTFVKLTEDIEHVIESIKMGESYPIFTRNEVGAGSEKRIFVCGDLNIDLIIDFDTEQLEKEVGGSAYNPWLAFSNSGFSTILFGSVGDDLDGLQIEQELKKENKCAFLRINTDPFEWKEGKGNKEDDGDPKKTGFVKIHNAINKIKPFVHDWDIYNNANDYNAEAFRNVATMAGMNSEDFVYVTSYAMVQKYWNKNACKEFFQVIADSGAKLIFDIARSSLDKEKPFSVSGFAECLAACNFLTVIGEFDSFSRLFGFAYDENEKLNHYHQILTSLGARSVICRYGDKKNAFQDTYYLDGDHIQRFQKGVEIFKDNQKLKDRRGKGDLWAAMAIKKLIEEEPQVLR